MERLDQEVIGNLRSMARQGQSLSEMFRELKRCLGTEAHIVTLLNYFRQAFCLTLADAKPIAALSRNDHRKVVDEVLLDDLLLPVILKRRPNWDSHQQG